MHRSALGLGTALVVLAAIVGLGVAGAMSYTARPSFCRSCHLMETRYVTWRRSAHADAVGCISCHSEPGRVNEARAHLSATRYLWALATGRRSGAIIRGTAFSDACAECHPASTLPEVLYQVRGPGSGHTPAHAVHADVGVECADCHYQPSFHVSEPAAPMATCVGCHPQLDQRSPGCQACHDGAAPTLTLQQTGWVAGP